MDHIEEKVHEVVLRVCQQRTPAVSKIDNGHRLTGELGLASLDFARIIAILEMDLGTDPFSCQSPITGMRTVGDLCDAYRKAQRAPSEAAGEKP